MTVSGANCMCFDRYVRHVIRVVYYGQLLHVTGHNTTNIHKVTESRIIQYNIRPLAPAIIIDADTSLVEALLTPEHETHETP